MTIKQLIEELKKFPEDMDIMFIDYEYGLTDVNTVKLDTRYNYYKHAEEPVAVIHD